MRTQTRHMHAKVAQSIVAYATRYQTGPLRIPELAYTVGLSRWHLSRIFRAQTGEAPMEFLRRIMLERAAHRLIHSEISVGAIGKEACYQNSPSFTRSFLRAYGITPKSFRSDSTCAWELNSPAGIHWTPHPEKIAYSPVDLVADGPEVEIVGVEGYAFGAHRVYGPYRNVLARWRELYENVLKGRQLPEGTTYLTIFNDSPSKVEPEKIRIDLCVVRPDGVVEPGLAPRQMPKGVYVRTKEFIPGIPGSMAWCPLLRHWVPQNGSRPKNVPTFEESEVCPAHYEEYPLKKYVGLEIDLDR